MAALSTFIVTHSDRYAGAAVMTEQLLQDGGAPEYVYHDRAGWCYAVFMDKNMAAKDIHKEMLSMYGEHCLSRQATL
jgi:hypothetical protein